MAKLTDFSFRGMPKPVQNFKDEIYTIINYGKVAHPVVGAVPAWNTYEGEMAFFHNTAASPSERIYVRLSSAWVLFAAAFDTTGSGGLPDPPVDSIQFNSGGQFGGDQNLLWSSTTRLLMTSGRVVIRGSAPAQGTYFEAGGIDLNSDYPFVVGSVGFVGIGSGNMGAFGRNVLCLSNGFEPDRVTNSVQVYAKTVASAAPGLHILPGAGGIHEFGDGQGSGNVRFRAAQFTLQNTSGTVAIVADAAASSIPQFTLTYGGNQGADLYYDPAAGVGTNIRANPSLTLGPNYSGQKEAFICLNSQLHTSLTRETYCLVAGAGSATVGIQGAHYQWDSGNTIINQRTNIFLAPRFHGLVAAGGSAVTTISNAATMFIEGPPNVITPGSLTVVNRYALWIGTGDILVGGKVISGGNTTVLNPAGTLFTTTATGVAQNTTAETTLITGHIGTTAIVANTFSEGRAIRLTAWGYYNTAIVPDALTMRVKLGGATVLSTGAQTPAGTVSSGGWSLNANIICRTTGGAGTAFSQGDFPHFTGVTYANWPMVTTTAVTLNTTANNVLEVTAQWGGASAASELFMSNCVAELLN